MADRQPDITVEPTVDPLPSGVAPSTAGRGWRLWGLLGVVLLLGRPAYSLGVQGWGLLSEANAAGWRLAAGIAIVVALAWGEGLRALARSWAPFVARRLHAITDDAPGWARWLAPAYATGLVDSDTRLVRRAWIGAAAIVVAVIGVRFLPPFWRGSVDLGVASALAIGVIGLVRAFAAGSATDR